MPDIVFEHRKLGGMPNGYQNTERRVKYPSVFYFPANLCPTHGHLGFSTFFPCMLGSERLTQWYQEQPEEWRKQNIEKFIAALKLPEEVLSDKRVTNLFPPTSYGTFQCADQDLAPGKGVSPGDAPVAGRSQEVGLHPEEDPGRGQRVVRFQDVERQAEEEEEDVEEASNLVVVVVLASVTMIMAGLTLSAGITLLTIKHQAAFLFGPVLVSVPIPLIIGVSRLLWRVSGRIYLQN